MVPGSSAEADIGMLLFDQTQTNYRFFKHFFLQFALASHLIGQVVTIRHGTRHNHFFGYILPLP
jgi:hypothetical protein